MVYWARLRTSRCLTAMLLLKSPESLENPQTPEFPQACEQPNEFEFMSPCKANERKLPGGVGRGTKPTFLECKPRRRIQGPGLTGRASDTLCRQAILDKRPKVIGTESLPASGVFDDNRYFDVFIEYAKAGPDDILIRIEAINRGPELFPANSRHRGRPLPRF